MMSKVRFGAEGWNNRFRGDGWAYGKEPNALARPLFQQMVKAEMLSGLQRKGMKLLSSIYLMWVKKNVQYYHGRKE